VGRLIAPPGAIRSAALVPTCEGPELVAAHEHRDPCTHKHDTHEQRGDATDGEREG
jgi:hypothetical protein